MPAARCPVETLFQPAPSPPYSASLTATAAGRQQSRQTRSCRTRLRRGCQVGGRIPFLCCLACLCRLDSVYKAGTLPIRALNHPSILITHGTLTCTHSAIACAGVTLVGQQPPLPTLTAVLDLPSIPVLATHCGLCTPMAHPHLATATLGPAGRGSQFLLLLPRWPLLLQGMQLRWLRLRAWLPCFGRLSWRPTTGSLQRRAAPPRQCWRGGMSRVQCASRCVPLSRACLGHPCASLGLLALPLGCCIVCQGRSQEGGRELLVATHPQHFSCAAALPATCLFCTVALPPVSAYAGLASLLCSRACAALHAVTTCFACSASARAPTSSTGCTQPGARYAAHTPRRL